MISSLIQQVQTKEEKGGSLEKPFPVEMKGT